ncbi:MAG TPA: aldolase/citrate lyase family protein [Acetobacteraceae bacterium]|nr:aldolase/citrate lyase family protein [Acetobacteraceae bacterium]
MQISNPVRRRLEAGEPALGIGVRLARTVEIAKAMQVAGYDWLFIDLEHGPLSLDTASQLSLAALDAGIAPIVRVPQAEYAMATRALDNGALGIIMPHVNTAAEAREIVDKLKYPPLGHRSLGGSTPQLGYKTALTDATAVLNAALLTVVMLETPEAIANADEIASVEGVDVLLIGTNDLCAEMGIAGEFGHERVAQAYDAVVAACGRHGKWPGSGGITDVIQLRQRIASGARFVLAGADFPLLLAAATHRSAALRAVGP